MNMARLVSLGIVAALIACLGITFYQVIAPFLMPLFLAAMIALLCQPVLRYFLHRTKGRRALSAGLATGAIVGSVMLPLVVSVLLGILQFLAVKDTATDRGTRVVSGELQDLRERLTRASNFAYDVLFGESTAVSTIDRQIFGEAKAAELGAEQQAYETSLSDTAAEPGEADDQTDAAPAGPLVEARHQWLLGHIEKARGQSVQMLNSLALKTAGVVGSSLSTAVNRTVDLVGAVVGALVALFVFTLALYYFLLDGPDMIQAAQSLIPVEREHQQHLMVQFAGSVRAVVMATFLAAVGQGIATTLALQIVGMGHFFLFAIIATFSALIPMAGTWLVWVPCALWLGVVGESWGAAAFLTVVGIGPIGMMDNVVRTWVLKNDTSLHPLLAFVSVLGGLQVMGLWGVFIGPIVACCLHSLIEIFNVELRETAATGTPSADDTADDATAADATAADATAADATAADATAADAASTAARTQTETQDEPPPPAPAASAPQDAQPEHAAGTPEAEAAADSPATTNGFDSANVESAGKSEPD